MSKYKTIIKRETTKKKSLIGIAIVGRASFAMDHSHPNYFLPFDASTYFDPTSVTYHPYSDLYAHPSSSSNASPGSTAYSSMYRPSASTLRHPSSFYSATMQSESIFFVFVFVNDRSICLFSSSIFLQNVRRLVERIQSVVVSADRFHRDQCGNDELSCSSERLPE